MFNNSETNENCNIIYYLRKENIPANPITNFVLLFAMFNALQWESERDICQTVQQCWHGMLSRESRVTQWNFFVLMLKLLQFELRYCDGFCIDSTSTWLGWSTTTARLGLLMSMKTIIIFVERCWGKLMKFMRDIVFGRHEMIWKCEENQDLETRVEWLWSNVEYQLVQELLDRHNSSLTEGDRQVS